MNSCALYSTLMYDNSDHSPAFFYKKFQYSIISIHWYNIKQILLQLQLLLFMIKSHHELKQNYRQVLKIVLLFVLIYWYNPKPNTHLVSSFIGFLSLSTWLKCWLEWYVHRVLDSLVQNLGAAQVFCGDLVKDIMSKNIHPPPLIIHAEKLAGTVRKQGLVLVQNLGKLIII